MSRLVSFPEDGVSVAVLANTLAQSPELAQLASELDIAALDSSDHAPAMLDATSRGQVIDAALARIRASYVVAEEMERAIRARQRNHEYESVSSEPELARLLTT